jgi:hypothetical protein
MQLSLKYSLHAQSSYILGKPIIVGFRLTNLAETEIWVLKWYTPLEGIRGKILEVISDGEEIAYEGMMMKRGKPSRDAYFLLSPGGSAEAEFDLAEAYSLKQCNECRLRFKGRIHDVVFDQAHLPPADHEQNPVDAEGDPVSFRIESG